MDALHEFVSSNGGVCGHLFASIPHQSTRPTRFWEVERGMDTVHKSTSPRSGVVGICSIDSHQSTQSTRFWEEDRT